MSKTKDKQKVLFRSAEKLFEKYGYRKVSVDEIVKKAGVAKGTFYLYFKNKDELYRRIIENYYQEEIITPVESLLKEKELRVRLYVDSVVGVAYFQNRKILREIILKNPNYFSESVNFELIIQKNVELLKILFTRNSEEIRKDISFREIAEIYASQVFLIFQEKSTKKLWEKTESLLKIFVDGILSHHKWEDTLKSKKIIQEVKKKYVYI